MWKAYSKKDTIQLHGLLYEIVIAGNTENIHKIDFYQPNVDFIEWLDSMMIQMGKLGLIISAESANILIGFVLLGRNRIRK